MRRSSRPPAQALHPRSVGTSGGNSTANSGTSQDSTNSSTNLKANPAQEPFVLPISESIVEDGTHQDVQLVPQDLQKLALSSKENMNAMSGAEFRAFSSEDSAKKQHRSSEGSNSVQSVQTGVSQQEQVANDQEGTSSSKKRIGSAVLHNSENAGRKKLVARKSEVVNDDGRNDSQRPRSQGLAGSSTGSSKLIAPQVVEEMDENDPGISHSETVREERTSAFAAECSSSLVGYTEAHLDVDGQGSVQMGMSNATQTQTQTQVDDAPCPGADESDYVLKVLSYAGLVTDKANEDSWFKMGPNFSSSLFVASIRASIRGAERTRAFSVGLDTLLSNDSVLRYSLQPIGVQALSVTSTTSCTIPTMSLSSEPSLIRALLKVECLQSHLLETLLGIFLSRALEDDADDDLPRKILQNLCWLDFIIAPKALSDQLLQCLQALNDTKNRWLSDAIRVLPEILPDSEHARAVEHLLKMLRETRDSATSLIDALADLTVPSSLIPELASTVLDVLRSAPISDVPVIVRFLLAACADGDSDMQSNTLYEMRTRLTYLEKKRKVGDDSNDPLVLKEFLHGLLVHRSLCQTFLESFKQDRGDEPCIDIWLLLALSRSASYAQLAQDILKKIALKTGGERVFEKAIVGHRIALEAFLPELLDFAAASLRISVQAKSSETLRIFAGKVYQWMFQEMSDAHSRQEIVHALVSHCGAGEAGREEVDAALKCLRSIVRSDPGASALAPFSSYVRSLLNDLERFDPSQARSLFRVVCRLALLDGDGVDELKILLRKLLMSPDSQKQCLGVIGTVQLIACVSPSSKISNPDLALPMPPAPVEEVSTSKKKRKKMQVGSLDTQLDEESTRSMQRRSDVTESMSLIDHMLRETRHVATFDELSRMIERDALDTRVVASLSKTVQEAFEDWFLFETDGKPCFNNSLQETCWFGLEKADEVSDLSVKILPLLNQALTEPKSKQRLLLLAPMIRCLLSSSCAADACPDAILGCPLLLPNEAAIDALKTSSAIVRDAICASFFHACNWIREIVSSFSSVGGLRKDLKPLLCARLGTLVEAQKILTLVVSQVPEFIPPRASATEVQSNDVLTARRGVSGGSGVVFRKKGSLAPSMARSKKQASSRGTATTTSTKGMAKKKKKKSSTAMLNGEVSDDGSEDAAAESSSSEDDSQKEFPATKMEDITAEKSDAEEDDDEEKPDDKGAVEEDDDDEKERAKSTKRGSSKQPTAANAVDRALSSLRELSPTALQVLSIPNLRLGFGKVSKEPVTELTLPTIHIAALDVLLKACVQHVDCRLVENAGSGFRKRSPGSSSVSSWGSAADGTVHRAFEYEPEELVELIAHHCLPTLRLFVERICKRILGRDEDAENEEDETLVFADANAGISCIGSTALILGRIIEYDQLQRSHDGAALLLQVLRAFNSNTLASSTTNKFGTFTEDAPNPVDARPMLAEAARGVFSFFVKQTCDSGVLSNSLHCQVVVVQFLRHLVNLHDQVSDSKQDRVLLGDSLSALAKTLLKREWNSPSTTSPLVKVGKQNVGVLLDIFHEYSSNRLEAIRYSIDELNTVITDNEEAADRIQVKSFALLDSKNLSLFFSATLCALAKTSVAVDSRGDDIEDDLSYVAKLSDAFAECILFTKTARGSKNNMLRDAIRYGKVFLEGFVKKRMSILSNNLKQDQQAVVNVLATMQKGTRQLNNLCTHGKCKKDATILVLTPALRKSMESFLLSTKSMLKANKCDEVFTIGTLKARNLDGSVAKLEEIVEDD